MRGKDQKVRGQGKDRFRKMVSSQSTETKRAKEREKGKELKNVEKRERKKARRKGGGAEK